MDESKIELPAWLPWATTACLAALVACLGELWIIERMRSQLLRDQGLLAEAAMKGMENQLEAERIVNRGEVAGLRAAAPSPAEPRVALLLAAEGGSPRACGAVAWDSTARRGEIRLSGMGAQPPERDYQLWLDVPAPGNPADCGVFHAPSKDDGGAIPIAMTGAIEPGCRFILVDGKRGGAHTLDEAEAGGSIVLATLPIGAKIPDR